MANDVECPYCEKYNEINHDDGYGYQEDELYEQDCEHCDKRFTYTTYIIYGYHSYKADCLNGGKHDWNAQTCYPKEFTKMVCSMCDENREPTEEEMKLILNK